VLKIQMWYFACSDPFMISRGIASERSVQAGIVTRFRPIVAMAVVLRGELIRSPSLSQVPYAMIVGCHSSSPTCTCQYYSTEISCPTVLVISNGIGSLRISTRMKGWWAVPAFTKFFNSSGMMVLRPHFYATQVLNSTQTPQDRHRHRHEPIPKSPIHRRLHCCCAI
jgi:hypothetical protein